MDLQVVFLWVAISAIIFAILIGGWGSFMFYRNSWVLMQRLKMIDEDIHSYNRLVSYEEMMRRWWVWDIEKFIRSDNDVYFRGGVFRISQFSSVEEAGPSNQTKH